MFENAKDLDEVLYILFFNACAKLGSSNGLNLIKSALIHLPKSYYDNERLLTSLIDALLKCDDITTATSIIRSRENPPVETVGAIMKSKILMITC